MRSPETALDTVLEAYLHRLRDALGTNEVGDLDEILLETRSHVLEQQQRDPSRSVREVLERLGSPEEYARQFRTASSRPMETSKPGMMSDAILLLGRGPRALPILILLGCLYCVALIALLLTAVKLADPGATGLYDRDQHGRGEFLIVSSDPRVRGHEVLGHWFAPVFVTIAVGMHLSAAWVLRRARRNGART